MFGVIKLMNGAGAFDYCWTFVSREVNCPACGDENHDAFRWEIRVDDNC